MKTVALSFCLALLTTLPSVAADSIILTYGALRRSIRIESLEIFAKEGIINSNLRLYLGNLSPQQQQELRAVLLKPVPVDPVLLSRFFNSQIGEDVLTRAGYGVTIQGGRNGKFALRAAIVKAAFDPQGLTLLNVLRNLPTNVRLQGEYLLGLSRSIDRVLAATQFFQGEMARLATAATAANPVDFSQLPDLRQRGKFNFRQETVTINDTGRQRSFEVLLYLPETQSSRPTPVVIISHGLGSPPSDFASLAEHLASYGFLVALPQHIGSDNQRKQEFFQRLSPEIFDVTDFIERPKDISAVIDELERRNPSQFGGRLDVENVGVVGHSFGGYTALAVAGAQLNFDHLREVCDRPFRGLNVSLFLQCRALSLSPSNYQFRDARVKAVLAKNPFTSGVFDREGLGKIQIPVAFLGGNYDPATPFVLEQVRTFAWLNTKDKYLGLKEGQAHINITEFDAGIPEVVEILSTLELAEAALVDNYVNPITLAFLQVHLLGNAAYRPFLTSAYGEYLSTGQPFRFYFVDATAAPALEEAFKRF